MFIIGIDPGPVVGIVQLLLITGRNGRQIFSADAAQITPGVLPYLLRGLDAQQSSTIAIERFVVGSRAGRAATAKAGAITRDVIRAVADWARDCGYTYYARSAAEVKPWATDTRLVAAGLFDLTAGMRHARDAARHALFCAVRDYGLPDPLSSRAKIN